MVIYERYNLIAQMFPFSYIQGLISAIIVLYHQPSSRDKRCSMRKNVLHLVIIHDGRVMTRFLYEMYCD